MGLCLEKDLGKIPRGPSEWGDVLWQEPWAYEKRTPGGRWEWVYPIFFGAMGLAFLLFLLNDIFSGEIDVYLLLILLLTLLALFLPFIWGLSVLIRIWPRRIYEMGITYPRETFFGYRPEVECFIPFENIRSIHMEESMKDGVGLIIIVKLVVVDERGERVLKQHDEPNGLIVEWVDIFLSQHPDIERGDYIDLPSA